MANLSGLSGRGAMASQRLPAMLMTQPQQSGKTTAPNTITGTYEPVGPGSLGTSSQIKHQMQSLLNELEHGRAFQRRSARPSFDSGK